MYNPITLLSILIMLLIISKVSSDKLSVKIQFVLAGLAFSIGILMVLFSTGGVGIILGSSFMVMIAAVLTHQALLDPPKKRWLFLGVSTAILILLGWKFFLFSNIGDWGGFAIAFTFPSLAAALIATIWMTITLSRWRKLAGIMFSILLMLAYSIGIALGQILLPESI